MDKLRWNEIRDCWKDAAWAKDDTAGVLLVLFIVILLWGIGK